MHSLYVDDQTENAKGALSWHIARHMYLHHQRGRVVVITHNATHLRNNVQKQWQKLARHVQYQRAETYNALHIIELSNHVSSMQSLEFSTAEEDALSTDVMFSAPEHLLRNPPACDTMYIASTVPKSTAHQITSWMPRHGLVVMYAPFL